MKKQIYAIVALLVISVLPGCGKSKNDGVNGGLVYGSIGVTGGVNGQGGCYNLQQYYYTNPNSPVTLTFAGTGRVSPYDGGVEASMQAASTGLPGVNYVRSNIAGDSLQMYVTGNQAISVATLQPGTVALVMQRGGGYLCGIYINSYASGSNLTISASFWGAYGEIPKGIVSL